MSTAHSGNRSASMFSTRCCLLRARCHGFSLIEIIIAIGILSVGLLGAMRVFPLGLHASQRTELSSRATMLAQRTLEKLKLTSWSQLADGETATNEDPFEVVTQITAGPLEELVDPTRLKQIVVTVRWEEDHRPRTLAFVTYLRRDAS